MSSNSRYRELHARIAEAGIPMTDLSEYFRTKCRTCGHQRIVHDESGVCEGVMNRPCSSGCDQFNPE